MDLDAGQKTIQLGNKASGHVQMPLVQGMRDPVKQNCVQASITKRYFQGVLGRRIFALNGPNVVPQRRKPASIISYAC
jgi:hypothetical protein